MIKNIFSKLTNQKPIVYGSIYLLLIPIYALVYTYLPDVTLNTGNHEKGFISSLYFSVITITTLGYGDILPIGKTSQLLTASESILGIIFIGLFLNSLSHQHGLKVQDEEKKLQKDREERESINRLIAFNSLIELNIERYLIYTIPITIPILNRNNTQQNNYGFTFNDMQDLFKTTLRLTDSHFKPAVTYYFEELHNLKSLIEDLLKLGYLKNYSELEKVCLNFIKNAKELDFSEYILKQPNTRLGDKKGSEFDEDMIKSHNGEVKFLNSNSINAYVALYYLIKYNFDFINQYRTIVSNITKSNKSLERNS